ncbi:MAG: CPBP family intramembrane metalloprotease [Gemmataceae bacterium]|nr:CPBP family intramembrane metalloprotease [Gemmataceae bacterium]
MQLETDNYWSATKHPWACVLFVLPLLAIYEIGLYITGNAARNGADAWLRAALAEIGVSPVYGAPCLLVLGLMLWGLVRRQDRPSDKVGVWVGMIGESAAYALLLLALSQGLWHVLLRADDVLGHPSQRIAILEMSAENNVDDPKFVWLRIVSFCGAGIYEEALFRLLLFAGFLRLFAWTDESASLLPITLAAFASALLFAGAHHLGPNGDPFNVYVLAFRTFAGLYFAWLYHARGFGIVVGAHAGYDVLVGLMI